MNETELTQKHTDQGMISRKRAGWENKLLWAVAWTLILAAFASFVVWNLLFYAALGLSYAGRDLGDGVITQRGYDERVAWFHLVQSASLALIVVAILTWVVGIVFIVRRNKSQE